MIDVDKIQIGDKLRVDYPYLLDDGVLDHVVVTDFLCDSESLRNGYWVHLDLIEKGELKFHKEKFTLVATNTKYSDIDEGDTVEVACLPDEQIATWNCGHIIDQQGEVIHKSESIHVEIDGKEWRFQPENLRVVRKVEGVIKCSEYPKQPVIKFPSGAEVLWKESDDNFVSVGISVPEQKQSATGFLSKALELLQERGKDYDQPQGERSMGKTVQAFNPITGHSLKESESWLLLQLLKDVRQWSNPDSYHADSAEDCISYAALKAEALIEGK